MTESNTFVTNKDNHDTTGRTISHAIGPLPADVVVLPMRFVIAWMFFSAAWRRLVLDGAKMDPNSPAWIGQKVNNFYPHALLIKPILKWMISNPHVLDVFMWVFTFTEFAVGLGVAFGLLTRLAALGSALLGFSMLLGAGWLGATCLDEWQIGCWSFAAGVILLIAGGGKLSLDELVGRRHPGWTSGRLAWITTGQVLGERGAMRFSVIAVIITVVIMLATNQAFVGGLWGPLSNPSAKPHLQVSEVSGSGSTLTLTVFRDGGPDTYGAFVTEMMALDASCQQIVDVSTTQLAQMTKSGRVSNDYPSKVAAGKDGFIVPLGAHATLALDTGVSADQAAVVQLRDVSGTWWTSSPTCAVPAAK